MAKDKFKYEVCFSCSDPDFWRFNLFMIAVGYDADGGRVSFEDFSERIYETEYGGSLRTQPVDYDIHRSARLVCDGCAYVEVYVYAIANTLPASEVIRDTPEFPARLAVSADGEAVVDSEYTVNPWGGLTIVALRADARDRQK